MDLGIEGRRFLITGAGGGLGSAVARRLVQEGAVVILSDVVEAAVKKVEGELQQYSNRVEVLLLDLSEWRAFESGLADIGVVDGLVNICGGPRTGLLESVTGADWVTYSQSMMIGTFELTRILVRQMQVRGWGRVISSTSSGVQVPIPLLGISNSLRGAILGWSKTLSNEVARYGITVNVVIPGRISTARIRSLDEIKAQRSGKAVEDVRAESWQQIPAGRYGKPEEFADVVAFLASERASYVNGSLVRVDGGYVKSI